jgi:hypothetical protein
MTDKIQVVGIVIGGFGQGLHDGMGAVWPHALINEAEALIDAMDMRIDGKSGLVEAKQ